MSDERTPRGPRSSRAPQASGPARPPTDVAAEELARLLAGEHSAPHAVLGAHGVDGGVVVRAFHPDAVGAECVLEDGTSLVMEPLGRGGVFAGHVVGRTLPLRYRVRFRFPDGAVWERDDPYRFLPTVGELDEHLFAEGTHRRL
jgi:1,4-alpha-glucan branching enzyme